MHPWWERNNNNKNVCVGNIVFHCFRKSSKSEACRAQRDHIIVLSLADPITSFHSMGVACYQVVQRYGGKIRVQPPDASESAKMLTLDQNDVETVRWVQGFFQAEFTSFFCGVLHGFSVCNWKTPRWLLLPLCVRSYRKLGDWCLSSMACFEDTRQHWRRFTPSRFRAVLNFTLTVVLMGGKWYLVLPTKTFANYTWNSFTMSLLIFTLTYPSNTLTP